MELCVCEETWVLVSVFGSTFAGWAWLDVEGFARSNGNYRNDDSIAGGFSFSCRCFLALRR